MSTQHAIDGIVRPAEVLRIFACSKATLYRAIARGEIPKPLRISAGVTGWRRSTIVALLDQREREANNGGR